MIAAQKREELLKFEKKDRKQRHDALHKYQQDTLVELTKEHAENVENFNSGWMRRLLEFDANAESWLKKCASSMNSSTTIIW